VGAGGKAETVDVLLHHQLRVLDALGDLDLLLAGEKRDLAHLLEVHADGIVQHVELGVGLVFLLLVGGFLAVLVTIDLRGIDDIDLHGPQAGHDGVHLFRLVDAVREDLAQIVKSDVTLLLGQLDELAELVLDFRGVEPV
jgi:hypothetical protein